MDALFGTRLFEEGSHLILKQLGVESNHMGIDIRMKKNMVASQME